MSSLDFPRNKPRSAATAAGYRLAKLTRRILGPERTTALLLDAEWITWRLAYESAYEMIRADFPNDTYCITPALLAEEIPEGGTVIDIGCGFGRLCEMAAPYASRVLGIDRDQYRIAAGTEMPANVELRIADITVDLPNEHFDVAILAGVLEHLDDPIGVLTMVRDRADKVVVEVPDVEADPLNHVRRMLGRRWYTDDDHVREYTPDLLAKHLATAGWAARHWERRGKMVCAVAD